MTYRVPKGQLAFPRGERGRQYREVVEPVVEEEIPGLFPDPVSPEFRAKLSRAAGYKVAQVSLAALRRLYDEAKTEDERLEVMAYMEAATMRTMGGSTGPKAE